jgi:hypothetical protein
MTSRTLLIRAPGAFEASLGAGVTSWFGAIRIQFGAQRSPARRMKTWNVNYPPTLPIGTRSAGARSGKHVRVPPIEQPVDGADGDSIARAISAAVRAHPLSARSMLR